MPVHNEEIKVKHEKHQSDTFTDFQEIESPTISSHQINHSKENEQNEKSNSKPNA